MLHRPDTKAVEAIVVVGGIDSSAIEVQVVSVRLRVERRTPVVAVGAPVVETRPVAVARRGEVRQTYFFLECPEKLTTIRAVYCSENGVGCHLIRACGGMLARKPPRVFAFSHLLRKHDGQPMNLFGSD